jgi:hypothetical protein
VILIILRSNLKAAEEQRREIVGVYIKVLTNYFHIITLVNSFRLDWPDFVLEYYSA